MRINKAKAMELLRISPATMTRRLLNDAFIRQTGAVKVPGKTSDMWTFDEEKVRSLMNPQRDEEPTEYIDGAVVSIDGVSTTQEVERISHDRRPNEIALALSAIKQLGAVLDAQNERSLSLKQAAEESGLPRSIIKEAIKEKKIIARRRNKKIKIWRGREVETGRLEISLSSLRKFVYAYLRREDE